MNIEDQPTDQPKGISVGRSIAKGGAWMMLFKLAERSLSLVSVAILARLLMPEDFGVVAMAMSLIAMLELLGAFSFDMALIQNQAAERRHYDTAWTFNFIFASTAALILLLGAHAAADFYREERLIAVIYVLALALMIQGFENIGTVQFRKNMNFNREFKFLLLKKLAAVIVTVPLAFLWRNYWALVLGMTTGRVAGVFLSYALHPYRPRISLAARKELFNFSGWLMVNNLIFFAKNRTVELMIGRMLGPQALGTYTVSSEISNLPTTELIAPVNRAVYPGYAKLSHDTNELKRSFLSVIGIIAMFALPAGAGVAAVADPIVRVLLGEKWLGAVPIVSILAIFGSLSAMQSNTTYVFLALGKPQIETILGVGYVTILIASLAALTPTQGVIGAAWAYLLTVAIMTPLTLFLLARQLRLGAVELMSVFWRPAIATTMMYGAVYEGHTYVLMQWPDVSALPKLLTLATLGALAYVACISTLWTLTGCHSGAEKMILTELRARRRS